MAESDTEGLEVFECVWDGEVHLLLFIQKNKERKACHNNVEVVLFLYSFRELYSLYGFLV